MSAWTKMHQESPVAASKEASGSPRLRRHLINKPHADIESTVDLECTQYRKKTLVRSDPKKRPISTSDPIASVRIEKTEEERYADPSPGSSSHESNSTSRSSSPRPSVEHIVSSLTLLYPQLRGLQSQDFIAAEQLIIASDNVDDKDAFVLGSGAQGSVLKATVLPNEDEIVAVKVSRNVSILEEYLKIRQFSHTNIIQAKHFSVARDASHDGEDDVLFMAVYEYCDHGDLHSFAKQHREKIRDPTFLRTLASGVLEALAYLHENGYAHCDIKPENILLSHDFRPVLADFGMAQQCTSKMVPQGTPSFLAPEVARSWASGITRTRFDPNIDIFSLGVSAIFLLTGRYAFHRISAKLEKGKRGTYTFEEMQEWFDLAFNWKMIQQAFPEQSEFIFRCLAKDPQRRPSASQLLQSLRAK